MTRSSLWRTGLETESESEVCGTVCAGARVPQRQRVCGEPRDAQVLQRVPPAALLRRRHEARSHSRCVSSYFSYFSCFVLLVILVLLLVLRVRPACACARPSPVAIASPFAFPFPLGAAHAVDAYFVLLGGAGVDSFDSNCTRCDSTRFLLKRFDVAA